MSVYLRKESNDNEEARLARLVEKQISDYKNGKLSLDKINPEIGEEEMASINQFVQNIKKERYIWTNLKNKYGDVRLFDVDEKDIHILSVYGYQYNWECIPWSEAKVGEIAGEREEEERLFICKVPRTLLTRRDMTPEEKQAYTREQWRQVSYHRQAGTKTLCINGCRETKIVTEDYALEWPDQDVGNVGD